MRIVDAYPPNFDAIVAVFPRAVRHGVIFTYGGNIFAPGGADLSQWIIAHEQVHSLRQGADPEGWWKQYLADGSFRFEEELFAHRMEWRTWLGCGILRNRHDKRFMMKQIAGRLYGALYGNMCSLQRAKDLIEKELVE